jgi:hypothetical protein
MSILHHISNHHIANVQIAIKERLRFVSDVIIVIHAISKIERIEKGMRKANKWDSLRYYRDVPEQEYPVTFVIIIILCISTD